MAEAEAKALADVTAARAKAKKAAEADMATVFTEDEQAAEEAIAAVPVEVEKAAEDEFGAGFFWGFLDLKRRVALTHPEWDLTAFSRVNSDYYNIEVSIEEGDPATEVGTSTAGDVGKTRAAGETEEDAVEVEDEPAT